MKVKTNTNLSDILLAEILLHDSESPADSKLLPEEVKLFVTGWDKLIRAAAKKYVVGKRKYKTSFLDDCDHLVEMDAELIDLINYKLAADVVLRSIKVVRKKGKK